MTYVLLNFVLFLLNLVLYAATESVFFLMATVVSLVCFVATIYIQTHAMR